MTRSAKAAVNFCPYCGEDLRSVVVYEPAVKRQADRSKRKVTTRSLLQKQTNRNYAAGASDPVDKLPLGAFQASCCESG